MQHAVGGGCRGRLCGIAPQVVEGLDEIAAVGDAPLLADPSAANQFQREFQDFEIALVGYIQLPGQRRVPFAEVERQTPGEEIFEVGVYEKREPAPFVVDALFDDVQSDQAVDELLHPVGPLVARVAGDLDDEILAQDPLPFGRDPPGHLLQQVEGVEIDRFVHQLLPAPDAQRRPHEHLQQFAPVADRWNLVFRAAEQQGGDHHKVERRAQQLLDSGPDYLQPEFVDPLLRESQLAEVEQNLVERNLAEVVNPAPLDPPESLAAGCKFVNASRDVEAALVVFGDERSERGDEEFGAGDLQFVQPVDEERDAALCEQLLGMGEHHALPVLGRRDSETRVEGRPQGVVHRLAFGDRVEIDTQGQDRTVAVVPQVRILADQADQHRGLACARVAQNQADAVSGVYQVVHRHAALFAVRKVAAFVRPAAVVRVGQPLPGILPALEFQRQQVQRLLVVDPADEAHLLFQFAVLFAEQLLEVTVLELFEVEVVGRRCRCGFLRGKLGPVFVEIPPVIAGMVVEQQQQSGQRQQEQPVISIVQIAPGHQDVAFFRVGVARGVRDSVPVAAQRVEKTFIPTVEQTAFPVGRRDAEFVEDVSEAVFFGFDLPQQVAVAAQQVDEDFDVGFERDKPHARTLDPVLVVLVREIEPVPQPLEFGRQLRRRRAEQHDVVEQLHQLLELLQGDD